MNIMSKEKFESLTPYERGYIVYMCGSRDDQPNIPDELNPYPINSVEYEEYKKGQHKAYISVLDAEA